MKTIRTNYFSKPLSFLLSFLILFVSCSTPDSSVNLFEDNASLKEMSGEDLFRSILFKEGDLGGELYSKEDIAMMNSLDSDIVKELELTKNKIIKDLKNNHPNFFTDFKTQITSNDYNLVLNSLLNARMLVKGIVKEQNSITDKDIRKYENVNIKEELQKKNVYGKEACVAVLIVVLVLVLFVLLVPVLATDSEVSRLENEQIVSKIISINQ